MTKYGDCDGIQELASKRQTCPKPVAEEARLFCSGYESKESLDQGYAVRQIGSCSHFAGPLAKGMNRRGRLFSFRLGIARLLKVIFNRPSR